MNARSHVSIAAMTVVGLAVVFGTGCAAPVEGVESAASGSEAAVKPPRGAASVELPQAACSWDGMAWVVNGAHQDPGVGFYGPSIGWGAYVAHVSPSSCVQSSFDALSTAERQLMAAGCSQPFYWESWDLLRGRNAAISDAQWASCQTNPRFGCFDEEDNAILMMCPVNGTVGDYSMTTFIQTRIPTTFYDLKVLDTVVRTQSDDPISNWTFAFDYYNHVVGPTGAFYDTVVPRPYAGYGWVRLWVDPHGCAGGCMTKI